MFEDLEYLNDVIALLGYDNTDIANHAYPHAIREKMRLAAQVNALCYNPDLSEIYRHLEYQKIKEEWYTLLSQVPFPIKI